jgi:hypothetical protein
MSDYYGTNGSIRFAFIHNDKLDDGAERLCFLE